MRAEGDRGAPLPVAVAEGVFAGAVTWLVLVALATAALLVWRVPAGLADSAGMGAGLAACAVGGGEAARRRGRGALLAGAVAGTAVALLALVPAITRGAGPAFVLARLGAGAAAGAVGALGVAAWAAA
ncbi:MAG: hypothetical protein K6V73_07465 [Firmicutes bacterium]|nr:hypothetical protein [Bacillota bacterium]